jgi:hypothetical protein
MDVRVDGVDVADETVVDGRFALTLDGRPPVCTNEPCVHATDTDRRDLQVAAGGQNARIDLPVQHHCRDVERGAIGDAASVHERRVDTQCRRELRGLRPAAMYQNDADADLVKNTHLLHERGCRSLVHENLAACFQHEDLAFEKADIRRRMLECRYDDREFAFGCHWLPPSMRCSTAICASMRLRAS